MSSSFVNAQFPYGFRATNLGGFVQDDGKINSRLTLNLGLRWEYDGYLSEKYGNYANFWRSLVNAAPNPGSGCVIGGQALGLGSSGTGCSLAGFVMPSNYTGPLPTGLFKNTNQGPQPTTAPKDNFAPRVGFAWQPTGSNSWVLRGGAGYFYDLTPGERDTGNPITNTAPGEGVPVPGAATATLATPWVLPSGITPWACGKLWVPELMGERHGLRRRHGNAGSSLGVLGVDQAVTVPLTYQWNLNTHSNEFRPTWLLRSRLVSGSPWYSPGSHERGWRWPRPSGLDAIPVGAARGQRSMF